MPIRLFDSSSEATQDLFIDPAAIDHLYKTVEPFLPEKYKSVQGMAKLFQELGDELFHHSVYAIRPEYKDPLRGKWMPLHMGHGQMLTFAMVLETAALRAGIPMEDPAHANDSQERCHKAAHRRDLHIGDMSKGLRTNARQLRELMNEAAKTNAFMHHDEFSQELAKHREATASFGNMNALLDLVRPDNGEQIARMLEAATDALEAQPIVSTGSGRHQTQTAKTKNTNRERG